MNKCILCIVLFFSMSCQTKDHASTQTQIIAQNSLSQKSTDFYEIAMQLDNIKTDEYDLVVAMKLKKNSYFISPNSKGNYKGRFAITLNRNSYIVMKSGITETPYATEELDPFTNGIATVVKEDTTYKKGFSIVKKGDFKVSGTVGFVIEPSCTMETIPFVLENKSGKLTLKMQSINQKTKQKL